VHAQAGFGCLACHGGAAGHDAATGFLSRPSRRNIPRVCGDCHSDAAYMRQFNPSLRVDQLTEYLTSGHGQRLMQQNDARVATCTDCHEVHRIRPPTDPESGVYPLRVAETCGRCHADSTYMAGRQVPTDQLAEYRGSVHGRLMYEEEDLSAPTCNDCHGNHGAAPPGIGSIRNVCGQCHATMAESFAASGHAELFLAERLPGCETCHGNHAIRPVRDEDLLDRSGDVCSRCHGPADPFGAEFGQIAHLLDSLKTQFDRSREILDRAHNAGMEVSQAQFELEDVNNALTLARSAVHSFHVEPVETHIAAGLKLTAAGIERGEAALREHDVRRIGLGFSSSIIVILISGLLLKIRQIERRAGATATEPGEGEGHG
jgi:predicted CXXCH cytochrome family protein